MLPLGLMRVVIEEDGVEYDSRNNFIKESHKNIYAFVHAKYKSYIDKIADADGYMLVQTDSDGIPISFEAKDVPLELKEKIK